MKRIYADNAATTRPSNLATLEMSKVALSVYGNPSSSYEEGRQAKNALEFYRARLAVCLDCEPNEIIFTSGATEGNNTVCNHFSRDDECFMVKSSIEHPSVLETLYDDLRPDPDGIIRPESNGRKINGRTGCVSLMTANNEIGTLQLVEVYAKICQSKGIAFHTDATAAVGHIPVSFRQIGADYLTCSAHKFHGPRGVGILIVRNGTDFDPLMTGGRQERNRRAGTENLPAVAGMCVALEECVRNMDENMEKTTRMRDRLIDGLLEIKGTILNGDPKQRLPGNVNVSFDGIEGESLLAMLDANGIAASAGSACHTGSKEPSHVLLAIGRTREQANAALRLSIDETNTDEEIDTIIKTVRESVAYLRRFSPKWNEPTL